MDLIEKAKAARGALERTFAGLPGVKGYKEKELRREADKTVRDLLARDLDEQRQRLQGLQVDLLGAGGSSMPWRSSTSRWWSAWAPCRPKWTSWPRPSARARALATPPMRWPIMWRCSTPCGAIARMQF